MAVMDLVVSGTTYSLPQPMQNGYTEQLQYRGKSYRMASGALVRENTSTTPFHRFTLEWTQLTAAQKAIVDNAVAALIDGTAGSFTAPTGTTVTVVLGEGESALPQWEVRKVKANTVLSFSGKLELEKSA